MKNFLLLIITMVALLSNLKSQIIYKAGASALVNSEGLYDRVTTAYGIDGAVEFGIHSKWSVNVGVAAHFGSFEGIQFEKNPTEKRKNQQDYLIGIESDIRYHFKGLYSGFYVGVGGDHKHLKAKHYFNPTEDDPGILVSNDFSFGATTGTYLQLGNLKFNPYLYVGGGAHHYVARAKVGLNVVF